MPYLTNQSFCSLINFALILAQENPILCISIQSPPSLSRAGMQNLSCSRLMLAIAREEGVQYLFKGLAPRLVVVPSMLSWMYVLNEELEKLLLGTTKTLM